MELSFILPTFNRKDSVIRAIDSCLKIEDSSDIAVKVIVLDGYSTDGAWELLKKNYEFSSKVKLLQVEKEKGFQETAFYGLDLVETDYVTYMYNDDVLSDYYFSMVEEMISSQQEFIMGYGSNFPVSNKLNFSPLEIKEVKTLDILLTYFGYFDGLEYSSLPVSPIASVSRTEKLRMWRDEVRKFVKNSEFRDDLMMKQNIGPDLILYLFNLFHSGQSMLFCNSTAAQLSFP